MALHDSETVGPTWVRYRVLAVGWSLALLMYFQRQAFVVALPKVRQDIGFSDQQAGLLTAASLLAYGALQVPCGLMGDRLGARHLLTILVLGWSLLTGLTVLAAAPGLSATRAFALLVVLRGLFWAFQAGGFPVWARVVTDWIPVAERGMAQGTMWMASRLGGALSPFVFLWLFRSFGGWQAPLWIMASVGVFWSALFWPWFRNRPSEKASLNDAERALIESGRPPAAPAAGPVPWPAMLSSVNIWALSLMYGCTGFAGNFITSLLPLYLEKHRRLADGETTLVSSLPLAAGVISCVLGGTLSDWLSRRIGRKWGRRLVPSLGLACAGTAYLVVPHVQAVWLLALLFSTSFFCNDLMIGSAWAACADVGERYAGTVSGTMNMIGQVGGATGMVIAGRMLERGRDAELFLLFACSYALAALCWMAVDVTRPLAGTSRSPSILPATTGDRAAS